MCRRRCVSGHPVSRHLPITFGVTVQMRLIHPIYLDIPMLVSFAAAIEGGLSFGTEVTHEASASTAAGAEGGVKFGFSHLFSQFFDLSSELHVHGAREGQERSVEKSSRTHTEASVAILLYDRLRKDSGYIVDLETLDAAKEVEPGALIEIAGTIEKNAIDAMIDYIDAVNIMSSIGSKKQETRPASTSGKQRGAAVNRKKSGNHSSLGNLRDALDEDRQRTPISNVLLRCTAPNNVTAVVTLRTENLRDLTLSELHKNSVRVLGKVTRVVDQGKSMSPFENYGMALIEPEMLQEVFHGLSNIETVTLDLSEVQVKGPALQVLPLMVFV